MSRALVALLVGAMTLPAAAGSTVTPIQGNIGLPFTDGALHGWKFKTHSGTVDPMIGTLYDNMLTINGGDAHPGFFDPFHSSIGTQAFVAWTGVAQMGDDLHELAGPTLGGPTAVITSFRYGFRNTIATTTHTIRIYEMIPPSSGHPGGNVEYGATLLSLVIPSLSTGTAFVTVTGLSVHAGTAAWIKFGESGAGFPGTFWLAGGVGSDIGSSHAGILYDSKDYYGPGAPLQVFYPYPFGIHIYGHTAYAGGNMQIALNGFVLPAPAAIMLLGFGSMAALRRRHRAWSTS